MHSDLVNSCTHKRYAKFYEYLENPQKEAEKSVVKPTGVKLKDLLYPSSL